MLRREKINWSTMAQTLKEAEAVVAARARGEPDVSIRKFLRQKARMLRGDFAAGEPAKKTIRSVKKKNPIFA